MKEKSEELIVDMNDLTRKTYNKIALWQNENEGTDQDKSIALKSVSYEIVEMILTDAFDRLKGAKVGIKTLKGEDQKKKPFYKNFFF